MISGPSISTGKLGNAIFLPNTDKSDDNEIRLGIHQNDCFGNITLCPNGLTLAFWIKIQSKITSYSHFLRGTTFKFLAHALANNYNPIIRLFNTTHRQESRGILGLSYGEWYHFVITYDASSGSGLYLDGRVTSREAWVTIVWTKGNVNDFILGCEGGSKCTRVHYDDLRFWSVKKSSQFICYLWKIYK